MDENPDGAQAISSEKRVVARARWAEITFAIALSLYALLALFAQRYAYFSWDVSFDLAIQSISLPGFRALMVGVSALGSGWLPFALVTIAGLVLAAARFRLEALICVIEVAFGSWLNTLVKWLIGRPRPAEPLVQVTTIVTRESFPSGHVVFFVDFFGFLLFLSFVLTQPGARRRILFAAFVPLIALVGVSRVYLGAHWPSDVVGAYLAGGVWLMLTIEIYRRLKARSVAREASTGP